MDTKRLENLLSKYFKPLLFVIFLIALALRWWYLPDKAIFFSFDQARDGFIVKELLAGHLKILGPPVSGIPGLFHGVLYYYVIAPFYFVGGGDPVIVSYLYSALNALTIFVVYFLASKITGKRIPGIIAALVYAFSFEATQYSNLLTNASMGEWFTPLTYLGLYLWTQKKWKWGPFLTGIAFGFAIQSEIASAYHLVPILIWLFVYRKNIKKSGLVMGVISFILAVSSMIVSEVKFGFTGVHGVIYLLTRQDKITQSISVIGYLTRFIAQTSETFSYTLVPVNIILGGVVGFSMIGFALLKENVKRVGDKFPWAIFFITYIFAHLIALPFGGWNMRHIMVGATAGIAAFAGIFLWKYLSKNIFVLFSVVAIILSLNVYQILKENIHGQTIFSLGSDLVLSNETAILDYTYAKAEGKPFSISTLTSPLFINTTWSYLYNWYGVKKYGYLPYWIGRDQIGQEGSNLQKPPDGVTKHFFISESTYGIPELYVTYAKGDQEAVSTLQSEKEFGQIIVQERILKKK